MSQGTLSGRSYVNSNLFSGYYLDERVQDLDAWDCDDAAESAMEELQELHDAERELAGSYNEDTLVDAWIDEVLDILGFGRMTEISLPETGGFVDVLLFDDDEARRDAAERYLQANDDERELFERSSALLEAKQWDVAFDERFTEQRPYRNASHQIKHYLEKTPGSVEWGVLTNGRKWRLYGTKDYETETYYEVDLPELLIAGNLEAFKYFYVFFQPDAFRESAGTTFLDTVWSESETASKELGEDLQDNVFTALRVLGRGFVETNDLDIDPDDEDELDRLKEQSLVLLYRLIFVLYAEARGLIHPENPAAESEYDENFSLDDLRLDVHDSIGAVDDGFAEEYSEYSTSMWNRLSDLFRLIDEGEESLGIPPYDGGLFDHDENAFLTENEVSNRHLSEVVYRLSTTENGVGRYVLADYADLDTRHLGSVYEGLLEHQFRIAPEEYAAVAEDGGQVWKPATEVSVADAVETVPAGGLYVVNDQGERKATGAYYTPDYVVTYIVEETVGPLVEGIHGDLLEQDFETGTQEYLGAFLRRVTDLKVLDPAMGSGHFLTKATGYLAEQVMAEVREFEEEVPVGFDEQHVRREIAKECIYGVDLNGMAVELAKLSMWLETLAADQPLAFLDHHFKTGNSLVGSDLEEIEGLESDPTDDDQSSLASFGATREGTIERLMDIYQEFLAIQNETVEDVTAMKRKYAEIEEDELRQRLVSMANVHTAERFDLDVPGGAYEYMARGLEDDGEWASVSEQDWFRAAQAMAEEYDFLHWKLEFPEVFYDEDGSASTESGFDVVVGNPPYVSSRNEAFYEQLRPYIDSEYELAIYQVDTYNLFVENTHRITSESGYWSFIVPDSWIGDVTGEAFRRWLTNEAVPVELGIPVEPVFDADVDCIVIVVGKSQPDIYTDIWEIGPERSHPIRAVELNRDGSPLVLSEEGKLLETIEEGAVELEEIALTGRGIGPYHHSVHPPDVIEERAYHASHKVDESYRPELAGKDVDRYRIDWDSDRWISYGDWLAEPREPKLFEGPRLLCRKILSDRLCCTYVEDDWLVDQQIYVASQFADGFLPQYVTGILASTLMGYYTRTKYHENTELFPHIRVTQFRQLPVNPGNDNPDLDPEVADPDSMILRDSQPDANKRGPLEASGSDDGSSTADTQDVIANLVEFIIECTERRQSLNLDLLDYVTTDPDDQTLSEIGSFQPPETADTSSPLYKTSDDLENLRVGEVTCERDGEGTVVIYATARYKPEDESEYETDQWGYTETDPVEAFRITDLSDLEADLVEAFVPVAAEEAGGFAGFRETATKTNSLVDRLKALTLPDSTAVGGDLRNYLDARARADELDEKIERTDELIDEIVYELYGLTDEEIETVEAAVER